MAKKTAVPTLADALAAADVLTTFLGTLGDEEDAADEEGEWEVLDREETEGLAIKELRALAEERGIEHKKKADILAALEEGGHFGDDSDEEDDEDEDDEDVEEDEDDDDSDDEDDEDDEEGEYDRDELSEMSLKDLRKLAKEDGHDTKGLDQDAIIDLLMGEGDDEEDEDDEDEADEEDEDTEELDEDALNAMSVKELTALAKELEIKVPAKEMKAAKNDKAKKKILVNTILDSGEEE